MLSCIYSWNNWNQILPAALHTHSKAPPPPKKHSPFISIVSLSKSGAKWDIWLRSTSPGARDPHGSCPYRWETSVIPHSITLPWVASVTAASFGLPFGGGRITDARLVLTPRGALTVCQTVTVTLNSVSMMDLLRVQPRVSGYSFPPQDSFGS